MSVDSRKSLRVIVAVTVLSVAVICGGCGATRGNQATEQLVLSSAVDRSVSEIDFRPLSNEKVYLDTSYLRTVKGTSFVNADYVVSSLRQQIVAAGCLLQDSSKDADVIVEARMGTLGADDHRVTYGIPESNLLQSAASLIPGAPTVPNVPEIAVARREAREAAAKIAVFAYDRETRQAVWQSGISESTATARDTYVMGVGPFQGGTIREKTRLVGGELFNLDPNKGVHPVEPRYARPMVDYTASTTFQKNESTQGNPVQVELRDESPFKPASTTDSVSSGGVVQASAKQDVKPGQAETKQPSKEPAAVKKTPAVKKPTVPKPAAKK